MIKQVHLLISGFVQAVGFRSFVKNKAQKLGLTGWVRNLPNGWVEVYGEGEQDKLEELINLCRQGPPVSKIDKIEVEWVRGEKEFKNFETIF